MRQQTRTLRPVHAEPSMAADVHAFVLARLDAHLAELHQLRQALVMSRPSHPGARFHAAAASATGARRYATDIAQALNACVGAERSGPG